MAKRIITIEREIGMWGTRFKADLEVSKDSVKLIKGYVKGFTGVNFSFGGQSIGIGISDWDFWLTEEAVPTDTQTTSDYKPAKSYKVYISFRRIHFLVFNERAVLLVGEHLIESEKASGWDYV